MTNIRGLYYLIKSLFYSFILFFLLLLFANIPAIEAIPTPTNPNILASPVCGLDGLVVFELFSSWLPLLFEVFPPFELFPP